jgi:MFS family permease
VTGRRVPLYGWLTANAISLLGTRVSMIAIPWLVLVTTGSATRTGLVAAVELTPLILLKALGGPLVDRVGARRIAIACDLASLVVVGLIPLLHSSGHLSFPVLLVLVGLAGALRGPGDAATAALIPALARGAEVSFERVTGLGSAIERGASMLGAAAAGTLVATVGAANAITVDAVSFGICAVVLAVTTAGLPRVEREAPADPTSYAEELREGWHFLRHDPVLLSLCLMVAVTNLLDLAWSGVLMPVWGRESGYGIGAVGAVFAVWGGASMVGSLVAAAWGERLRRFPTYVVAFLVTGLPRFVLFALGAPLWLIVGFSLIGGCASGFLNPVLGAVLFERIPEPLVGRVTALNTAICWSLMPLGGLLGGLLVTGVGFAPAVTVIGVAYFAATMSPALLPSFRGMDRTAVSEPVAV